MTSPFKQQVAADVAATFINPLEFASTHDINGSFINVVVDRDVLNERQAPTASEYTEGIFKEQLLLYVATVDMEVKPVKGEILWLDGDMYLVAEVAENMGVLEITIEANEA